jgi:cellulose synthase/poly-beta-1,6-N-acetylglucosamine synthase-like glycosyltransferase
MSPAREAYRHGPYEPVTSDFAHALQPVQECASLTVVLPCFMPNEEGIICKVLDVYKTVAAEYPGKFRVLVVWNSPTDHPDIEAALKAYATDWPLLTVERVVGSTCKADNLNRAISMLDTNLVLFNDADTIVSSKTCILASQHLMEGGGYDFVQARAVYPWLDVIGFQESGFFAVGPAIVMHDSLLDYNVTIQKYFDHALFFGRGGFWRTNSIEQVGFDPQIFGEDLDSTYRAYFLGMRGCFDPNMLFSERVPCSLTGLTSQRTRWQTCDYERRSLSASIWLSPRFRKFEKFLLFSVLWRIGRLPVQDLPYQAFQLLNILWSFHLITLLSQGAASDMLFYMSVARIHLWVVSVLPWLLYYMLQIPWTLYKPLSVFCVLQPIVELIWNYFYSPVLDLEALHNYYWGRGVWVCTPRSV